MDPVLAVAIVVLGISLGALFASLLVFLRVRAQTQQNQEAFANLQSDWDAFAAKAKDEFDRRSRQLDDRSAEMGERLGRMEGAVADVEQRASQLRAGAVDMLARLVKAESAIAAGEKRMAQFNAESQGIFARLGELENALADANQRVGQCQEDAADMRERLNRLHGLVAETQENLERFEQYTRDFLEKELSGAFVKFDRTVGSVLGEMKSELLRGVERIDEIQSVVESKSEAQRRIFGGEAGALLLGERQEGEEDVFQPAGEPEVEEDLLRREGEPEGEEGAPWGGVFEEAEPEAAATEEGKEDLEDVFAPVQEDLGEWDAAEGLPADKAGEAPGTERLEEPDTLAEGGPPEDSSPDAETSLFGPEDVEAAEHGAEPLEEGVDIMAGFVEKEEASEEQDAAGDITHWEDEDEPVNADQDETEIEEDTPDAEGREAEGGHGGPGDVQGEADSGESEGADRPFDEAPAQGRLAGFSQPKAGSKTRSGRGLPALVRRMNKRSRSKRHPKGTRLVASLRRRRKR